MNRNSNFFMLPASWHLEPDVVGLPATAVCVWIAIIEFCQRTGNGGEMSGPQVLRIARQFPRGVEGVVKMIDRGSLVLDGPVVARCAPDCRPTLRGSHAGCLPINNRSTLVRIPTAARWLLDRKKPKYVEAGQGTDSQTSSEQTPTRARPRGKDRQTDREKERTPSGSVRSFSARAAPRSTGGATRPAPEVGDRLGGDEPPMKKTEALEMARKEIARTRGPNPGKAISFSRYDPNRHIVPLRADFHLGNGSIG